MPRSAIPLWLSAPSPVNRRTPELASEGVASTVGHRLAIGHFRLTDLVSRPDTDLSELFLWDLPPVASVPMLQWDIVGLGQYFWDEF